MILNSIGGQVNRIYAELSMSESVFVCSGNPWITRCQDIKSAVSGFSPR